jgi:CelD/BcsL family acetyltransferase involved in cellulose biosynthesis
LLSSPHWDDPDIRLAWERLAASNDPVRAIFRSPGWFDLLTAAEPKSPFRVAVVHDDQGAVAGVAPLAIRPVPLKFRIGGRSLGSFQVRVVDLLGGRPSVPENAAAYDCLFDALAEAALSQDGIRLADIPADGPLLQYLRSSLAIRRRFSVCLVDGFAPYQTLPLPANFDEYLAQFPRKKRYNLRRQERLLRECGIGRLKLQRWEAAEAVEPLMHQLTWLTERAKPKGAGSHPEAAGWYAEMASRGLLRCYTLVCGQSPVAALVGFQYGETYTVDISLYDPALARLSPGTTMTHLAVADLLSHRPVRLIDFGYGNPSHEQQPPRVQQRYVTVLLLHRTLRNRIRWAGYRVLQGSVQLGAAQVRHLRRSRGRNA